ncbi:MAG: GDYXXLXY domain-containing protein [Chitinophagales bacterium]
MKKPSYLIISFFVVMALYIAYPAYLINKHEDILNTGEIYRFKPRPIDPYDAFRGKYIILSYEQNSFPFPNAMETFSHGAKVYLEVNTDVNGFAEITKAHSSIPNISNYISTNINFIDSNIIYYNLPFDRYYLNEEYALAAEQAYNDMVRLQNPADSINVVAYVDVRVKSGSAIIEELYLQNQPIMEYLRNLEAK